MAHPRSERRQHVAFVAEQRPHFVGHRRRRPPPQPLEQRTQRAAVAPARAVEHGRPTLRGVAGQLADQAGLARTAHPAHQRQARRARLDLGPRRGQRCGRVGSAHHRERRAEHQRRVQRHRRGRVVALPGHLGHRHRLGKALQLGGAQRLGGHVVGHGMGSGVARGQDLRRLGDGAQPGRLHHWRAEPVVVLAGGFAGGDADADGQTQQGIAAVETADGLLHGHRAAQRIGGAGGAGGCGGERDHESVALALDLAAAEGGDRFAHGREEVAAQLVVGRLTDAGQQRGGPDQITEENRDLLALRHPTSLPVLRSPNELQPWTVGG